MVLDVLGLQLHEVVVEEEDKEEDPADWQHCLSVGHGYRNCRNCSRMYLWFRLPSPTKQLQHSPTAPPLTAPSQVPAILQDLANFD